MKPYRIAMLHGGPNWQYRYLDERSMTMKAVDEYCSFFAGTITRCQVFDKEGRLLADYTFHPILDEVT